MTQLITFQPLFFVSLVPKMQHCQHCGSAKNNSIHSHKLGSLAELWEGKLLQSCQPKINPVPDMQQFVGVVLRVWQAMGKRAK